MPGLMRCDGYDIVMQEVPGEVSLAINVTECPYHCVGCHSPHLSESYGKYVKDVLPQALKEYKDLITCVCFMGGDHHPEDLADQCRYIKANFPNLKIALYTGANSSTGLMESIKYLDYIKLGKYSLVHGGLDSPKTNQVMYKRILSGCPDLPNWEDITHLFWRKHENQVRK